MKLMTGTAALALALALAGCSSGSSPADACKKEARGQLAQADDYVEVTFTRSEADSTFVKGTVGRYVGGADRTVKYWECTATEQGGQWKPTLTFTSAAS